MIEVRGLQKGFDGQPVLRGIDLDIRDGETMVILGPSGQGKTVFIKALVRLLEPDAGSIAYDGANIVGMDKRAFREFQKDIAFVFQNSALFDFLSVNDNLSLFLQMHHNRPPAEIAERVSQALAFVGLDTGVLAKFPEELSGGMKKRVAIARAMIKRPKYLFYDEPTTGLDRGSSEKVSELIRMLRGEIAVTSIIVTHDIALMQDVSDRVALLKEGRIVFVGGKDEISAEMLEFLYQTGENHGL